MNVARAEKQLAIEYPGVDIKHATVNHDGVVTELVGEIDRQLVGSDRDVAVVVADRSAEHYHKVITEEYEILKGVLRVFIDGEPIELTEGQKIVIEPGTRHMVEGDGTWFLCYSTPDWFPGDLHLVD